MISSNAEATLARSHQIRMNSLSPIGVCAQTRSSLLIVVKCVFIEVEVDGDSAWIGAWTVSRSPSGNRQDWEALLHATTPQSFANVESAHRAGEDEGTAFARQLQGDDCLEPTLWCMETSLRAEHEVLAGKVRYTSQRGANPEMKTSSARCSHLH